MPDSTSPQHDPASEDSASMTLGGSPAEAGAVPVRANPDNSVLWDLDGTFEQPRLGSPAQNNKQGLVRERRPDRPSVQSPAASPSETTQEERRQAERRKATPPTKPAGNAVEGKRLMGRNADKKAKRERAKQRHAQAQASRQVVATHPTRQPKIGKYGAAGILCATAGIALAVGPQLSHQVAQALAPMGNTQVHSGTLITAGIALIGVGVLRRVLSSIRETVASVGNETQPLKQLARDNEILRKDVVELRAASKALRTKLDSIQAGTKTWNDSVKDSNDALVSQINQLEAMLRGQHKSWRSALEASLQDASERTVEHVDQGLKALREGVGSEMERRHGVLSDGLAGLAASAQQAALDGAQALQDLGGHVDEQIERQAQTSSEGFTALEARLDRLERERASSVEQLTGELERGFAASSAALQELRASGEEAQNEAAASLAELRDSLEGQFEAQSAARREGLVEIQTRLELQDLAQSQGLLQLGDRMHQELGAESEALQESARANAELAREEAAERTKELEQRLGAAMQQRHDALSDCLAAVAESAQQAALDARAAAAGPQELRDHIAHRIEEQSASQSVSLLELEARLDRQHQDRVSSLEQLGDRLWSVLAAEADRRERLEQQVLEQLADLRSVMREAAGSINGSAPDVKQDLDRLGAQIEESLLAHTDVLASELMAVAGLSRETAAALQELVTAPAREASPPAPTAAMEPESPSPDSDAEGSGTGFAFELAGEPPLESDQDRNDAGPVLEPNPEGDTIEDMYADIPPALPRLVESRPAPELLEQPAGDNELGLERDSDAGYFPGDPFYGPNSDYGF